MICNLDDIIKNSRKILLLSHMNPDGDTLGSMCAMYSMIYKRFKIKSDMNVVSNIPYNYKFLPNIDLAQRYYDKSLVYDLVITLDVAAIDRVMDSKILFEKAKCTVNIDHHKTNPKFGDYQIIEPNASSCGEVLFNYFKKNNLPALKTLSIDYVDNDKNFVKSDFQPNSDNYYIDIMQKAFNTNHTNIVIDTPELAETLKDAMIARDFPGMADVDSSLLLFCKNVKKHATVTLTGECSDEIFGGYPWFFRDDALNSGTFPWSIALDERQTLLNPEIAKKVHLKDYVNFRYAESLNEVNILDTDSKETQEKRKISHLTLNWFMQTLLDRSDRMAMYNGFEIRVPFCDYRLAQYVWNIPWEIKALNGREKGLLRYVMKDLLPSEIVDRKKSPYPKTWNPTYLQKVKGMLTDIMENKNAPINSLLNRQYILDIIKTDGRAFSRPWFGQLMTGPQLMAYLCQVNMWLEKYQPTIDL